VSRARVRFDLVQPRLILLLFLLVLLPHSVSGDGSQAPFKNKEEERVWETRFRRAFHIPTLTIHSSRHALLCYQKRKEPTTISLRLERHDLAWSGLATDATPLDSRLVCLTSPTKTGRGHMVHRVEFAIGVLISSVCADCARWDGDFVKGDGLGGGLLRLRGVRSRSSVGCLGCCRSTFAALRVLDRGSGS